MPTIQRTRFACAPASFSPLFFQHCIILRAFFEIPFSYLVLHSSFCLRNVFFKVFFLSLVSRLFGHSHYNVLFRSFFDLIFCRRHSYSCYCSYEGNWEMISTHIHLTQFNKFNSILFGFFKVNISYVKHLNDEDKDDDDWRILSLSIFSLQGKTLKSTHSTFDCFCWFWERVVTA